MCGCGVGCIVLIDDAKNLVCVVVECLLSGYLSQFFDRSTGCGRLSLPGGLAIVIGLIGLTGPFARESELYFVTTMVKHVMIY